MEGGIAISVRYWVSTDSAVGFPDLQGVEEFRNELAEEYAALVRGRPTGAGGPVHMLAQVVSGIPWSHVVQLIIDGVAYDLIKEGSRSFILRPFISAYRKLRDRNRERSILRSFKLSLRTSSSLFTRSRTIRSLITWK